MNTMNMPGFTAEASLYKTSGDYRLVASGGDGFAGQAVTPALPIIDTIWRGLRCVDACVACAIAGGVGNDCWRCRNCIIILTN